MLRCEIVTEQALGDVPRVFQDFEFTDNHMHIDPGRGRGIDAVREFEKAGGRHLFLVNKTVRNAGLEFGEAGFEELFEFTVQLSREIREKTGVRSYAVIGVHPAEFALMCEESSVEKALDIGKKAMDAAGRKVSEGRAVALGEIGTPHYEVKAEVLKACEELLSYSLGIASDLDCAVQLHTGTVLEGDFMRFRELAREANLDPKRVIKHYSPPRIMAAEEAGVYPSLIASKENIEKARKEGNRFLMESDYIDDSLRPGAVVGPKSVPRVSNRLFEKGVLDEEDLWRIHCDNVQNAYGIELD